MAAPSSTSFQRPDLGQAFGEFDLEASHAGLIGPSVLRIFNSEVGFGNFSKIPVEELLKEHDYKRAARAGYQRDDLSFEQDSFLCEERGVEELLDDRERAIYGYTFRADMVQAMRARDKILRNFERDVATAVFNATTWTGAALTTAVGTEWSTQASSTPVQDVRDAAQKVRESSGQIPNAVIMGWEVWNNLQTNAEVVDRIKYSGRDDPKDVSLAALAALFGVDQVLVGGGIRNTANAGATASLADIWSSEYVMVAKLATSDDLMEPCIGRTFHFTADGSSPSVAFEQYRDEKVRSDVMRGRMDYHTKIIYPQAGHLLSNITA